MVSTRWFAVGGAAAAIAVLAFGGWWFFLQEDAPPPLSLADAVATASSGTEATTTPAPRTAAEGTPEAATTAAPSDQGLEGAWVVDPSGSIVGYRVREELASIGSATAVGRTSDVEGTLTFDGATITAVSVTADLRTLQSDDSRRDRRLRSQAIETDTYPEATFVLAEPIRIEGDPADGQPITATAVGDFTIHGVTNRVELPLEGQHVDGHVVIVGSMVILMSDYGIEAPTAPLVLSVSEEATIEMQVAFVRG